MTYQFSFNPVEEYLNSQISVSDIELMRAGIELSSKMYEIMRQKILLFHCNDAEGKNITEPYHHYYLYKKNDEYIATKQLISPDHLQKKIMQTETISCSDINVIKEFFGGTELAKKIYSAADIEHRILIDDPNLDFCRSPCYLHHITKEKSKDIYLDCINAPDICFKGALINKSEKYIKELEENEDLIADPAPLDIALYETAISKKYILYIKNNAAFIFNTKKEISDFLENELKYYHYHNFFGVDHFLDSLKKVNFSLDD